MTNIQVSNAESHVLTGLSHEIVIWHTFLPSAPGSPFWPFEPPSPYMAEREISWARLVSYAALAMTVPLYCERAPMGGAVHQIASSVSAFVYEKASMFVVCTVCTLHIALVLEPCGILRCVYVEGNFLYNRINLCKTQQLCWHLIWTFIMDWHGAHAPNLSLVSTTIHMWH